MNRFRERLAFFVVTAILVVIIILMRKCGDTVVINDDGEFVTHTYDTTFVEGVADTTYFRDTITSYTTIIRYIDSIRIREDGSIMETRLYQTEVSDSLIEGTITTELDLDSCKVINQGISYTPKFPKFITRVDTLKTTETITIEKIRRGLYFGVEVGGNKNAFNAGPKLSLVTKKNMLYSYRYGIVDNTHNVGVAIKLGK
jgi:hypothetical protein